MEEIWFQYGVDLSTGMLHSLILISCLHRHPILDSSFLHGSTLGSTMQVRPLLYFGRMQCMWCTPVFNCVKKGRTNVCACAGAHLWKHGVTEITSISKCAVNGLVCVGLGCVVSGWRSYWNTCRRSYNAHWPSDDFCARDAYTGESTFQRENGGANSRKTVYFFVWFFFLQVF